MRRRVLKLPITLMALAALMLGLAFVLRRGSRSESADPENPASLTPSHLSTESTPVPLDPPRPHREHWRRSRAFPASDPEASTAGSPPAATGGDWLDQLLGGGDLEPPSPEILQRWFDSGRTNAADLLAVRQAGGGSAFLERALKEFPNDPRVLLAATVLKDEPAAQRERLERLKAADPENALADYLAARNEFKAGNTDQAIANLLTASTKKEFKDYARESALVTEELFLHAGRSPAEAKGLGAATTLLPHLSQLKELSQSIADAQNRYLAAGDTASAQQLARLGVQLAEHLSDGDGSMTLIGERVGLAIGKIAVKSLPPDSTLEFLGSTPAEYSAHLEERRLTSLNDFQQADSQLRAASDADRLGYFERLLSQGEHEAILWLKQRQTGP